MLTVSFNTDNDAFTPYVTNESARILREIADMLEAKHINGVARDYNGNIVGAWALQLEKGDGDI